MLTNHLGAAKNKDPLWILKAVNLTIDEDTWRAARRVAAERDTSVSAIVREALEHLTKTSERREEARREIQAMIGSFGGRAGLMPSQEERSAHTVSRQSIPRLKLISTLSRFRKNFQGPQTPKPIILNR